MKYISLTILSLTIASAAFAADAAKGKEVYDKVCAACHGPAGGGDGPAAAALPPNMKPRNFQVGEFKVATDDAKMKDVIHKGGAAFGLSPLMAPQPSLTDADLDNVVAYVHSLKK